MDDSRRDRYIRQAAARWAHLPEGEDRDYRVRRTAAEIAAEAELVSVRLPPLDNDQACDLLDEAILAELHDWVPLDESALHVVQPIIDEGIDRRYRQMLLLAREQAAPISTRARLIERRIARRLRGHPHVSFEALSSTIRDVAELLASEDDATIRALAEGAAITKILKRSRTE